MIISLLPIWFPLIWAATIAIYWHSLWKEPINNWLICILVFAVNFFFFSWSFIIFLIIAIVKSGVLNKLINKKDEPK